MVFFISLDLFYFPRVDITFLSVEADGDALLGVCLEFIGTDERGGLSAKLAACGKGAGTEEEAVCRAAAEVVEALQTVQFVGRGAEGRGDGRLIFPLDVVLEPQLYRRR